MYIYICICIHTYAIQIRYHCTMPKTTATLLFRKHLFLSNSVFFFIALLHIEKKMFYIDFLDGN